MEEHNGGSETVVASGLSEVDAEDKPPWNIFRPDSYHEELSSIAEDREISREEIEHSIRKFEELSKQLEERSASPALREDDDDPLSSGSNSRRFSLDAGLDFNPLSLSYELSNDHLPSEEERSKSDGETEDLLLQSHQLNEEERSKSEGEQNEEEDDDAVPLKIQAVVANKSNKLLLSNSWLKTVPSEVWDLTQLTELDLSANYLKKVSKSIGRLTCLKKLRLNHNQLSILPKEVWGLTTLTVLLLNNNSLKAIPKDIKNLTRLKTLDLSSNQINEISPKEGLISLTSLIELRLRNNALSSIPIALAETMTNLQVLWLEGNPLASIPKSIIKKPASAILSYIKEHPNPKKPGKPSEPIKSRNLRKSPPVVPGKSNVLPHGKKDMHIIAEKELKKRKREQLEEMRKHMEVEKKVKLLEHELMLANAKALKFEEEVRKVEEQKLQEPPPTPPHQQPLHFAQLPPHVPRQLGVVVNKPAAANGSGVAGGDKPPGHNFEWEIPMSELTFGPRIGRGGYGEVFRGMWSGTEVAIKMLFTDNMSAKLITDLRNEVELLCKLRHPNIVLFMGACTEPETPCIVTEYLGRGSLASILQDESIEVDWGLRLQIGLDCARGMAYLHSRNPVIIHRDLKTDNLLVDDNWQVKVADFGLATVKLRTFAKTMCGTTGWVAPEVLAEEGYTEKADVYSFAIILWEMLTRQVPYAGKNTMQVVRSVDRGERLAIPDDCPQNYKDLIHDCWATDPATRPSFVEVLRRMEKMRVQYLEQKLKETKAQQQQLEVKLEPMVIDTAPDHASNNSNDSNHESNLDHNNESVTTFQDVHTGATPMSVDNIKHNNTTNSVHNNDNNNNNNNNNNDNNSNNEVHQGDKDNNT